MIDPKPHIGTIQIVAPLLVSILYIGIMSLLTDRARQRLSALIIAGAGGVYFGGGFGPWEIAFCIPMFWLAYRGLDDYRYVGVGWILHVIWDVLHHLYGRPILPFIPLSSFGCALCDVGLVAWYLMRAPVPWSRSATSLLEEA